MGFRWECTDDGTVKGDFDATKLKWLHDSMPGYLKMIDTRIRQYRYYDPLCDHLGIPLPVSPLESNTLKAICEHWCGTEDNDALRYWMEADLLTRMKADAETVINTLPSDGTRVELRSSSDVHAWFWVLLNMRVVYGSRCGLTDLINAPEEKLPFSELDRNSLRDQARYTMWWLGRVAHGLQVVSGQALPELTFH